MKNKAPDTAATIRQASSVLLSPYSPSPYSLTLIFFCFAALWPAAQPLRAETAAESAEARQQMVDRFVVSAGVTGARVLSAMRSVPRHEFVTPDQRPLSYLDLCLPIGGSQTISPPFMVASMTERIAPDPADRVLEVGTGSGYQAAVLSGL